MLEQSTSPSSPHSLVLREGGGVLHAGSGDVVVLRGDIGSGKTCWLERLAGLRALPAGLSVRLDDQEPGKASQSVRMLFDRWPRMWLGQTVAEELLFGLKQQAMEEELVDVLAAWDLSGLSLATDVDSLNRLQSLQVSLATMQLARPALALLDNPTDALPVELAVQMAGKIADWASQSDTIIVVACNRWHDWRDRTTQTWQVRSADALPCPI